MAKVAVVTGASQGLGLPQVAAVKVWARELADEAARRDIPVNAACLGLVDTDVSRPGSTTRPGRSRPMMLPPTYSGVPERRRSSVPAVA
jgi:NAD(P)-dependent dehydrogenase (short-subunit alcohol dehydrogenase family)